MQITTLAAALFLVVACLLFEPSSSIPRPFVSSSKQSIDDTIRKKNIKPLLRQQQQQHKSLAGYNKLKSKGEIQVLDYGAIGKYVVALAVQVTLSFGMWMGVDWTLHTLTQILRQQGYFNNTIAFLGSDSQKARWIKFCMVYILNLQVGIFNPLPTISERTVNNSPGRKRPSWTPPGWVFAVMWPLFVFGTRAYTMVVIADHVGKFSNPVTFSMMVHFGFGGLWSSINRVEERLGLSMLMLYGLFLSKAYTAYVAYRIVPGAGIALASTLSWLFAAAALGTDTWRLNPDPITGKLQALVPTKTK